MKRALHYLRITWTVFLCVLIILIIGLWARSYWWADSIIGQLGDGRGVNITSHCGHVFMFMPKRFRLPMPWHFEHKPFEEDSLWQLLLKRGRWDCGITMGAINRSSYEINLVAVNDLWAVLVVALLAVAPWFRWRFSLRTLLITTTIIALALGLLLSRRPPHRHIPTAAIQ